MPPDLRLVSRWHVDLCRQASAICAARRHAPLTACRRAPLTDR
ncbi:putative leader peptide [Streptomyces sp. Rer75]